MSSNGTLLRHPQLPGNPNPPRRRPRTHRPGELVRMTVTAMYPCLHGDIMATRPKKRLNRRVLGRRYTSRMSLSFLLSSFSRGLTRSISLLALNFLLDTFLLRNHVTVITTGNISLPSAACAVHTLAYPMSRRLRRLKVPTLPRPPRRNFRLQRPERRNVSSRKRSVEKPNKPRPRRRQQRKRPKPKLNLLPPRKRRQPPSLCPQDSNSRFLPDRRVLYKHQYPHYRLRETSLPCQASLLHLHLHFTQTRRARWMPARFLSQPLNQSRSLLQ